MFEGLREIEFGNSAYKTGDIIDIYINFSTPQFCCILNENEKYRYDNLFRYDRRIRSGTYNSLLFE